MYCFFGLLATYIVALFFMMQVNLFNNWFYVGLSFIGIYLFIKTYFFRSDSSLFLGTIIFLLSVLGGVSNIFNFSAIFIIAHCILIVGLGFLSIFTIFHNKSNFGAFIFFLLLYLPLILFSFYCINLVTMILLLCLDILIFLVLMLVRKRKWIILK